MAVKFGIPYWISPVRMLAELGVQPDDVTDIVISHAHFDHMGSIGKFPKAQIYIQKSELLSWHEAMALPPQFGFITAIIDPDDLRHAFDASVEHRLTLLDGDKDNVAARHPCAARRGPHHGPAVRHRSRPRAGGSSISGDCVYDAAQHHGPQQRRRLCAARQRRRQHLGAAEDHRPHQHRDRRRYRSGSSSCTTSTAGPACRWCARSRASASSRPLNRSAERF